MSIWREQSAVSTLPEVGGKGLHLQKLIQWGAPVPPFFVLSTDCYRFWKEKGELHPELTAKFKNFLSQHPLIALRSSMIGEDQLDASFAGLFETVLNVDQGNWQQSLIHIYESVTSPRVEEYLQKKNIQIELLMAVVVQAQVNVEKSGVLFTRSPVSPTSAVAIDAAFGMGEGVVSGHTEIDHYKLTRAGELIEVIRNTEEAVLSETERKELLELCLRLEKRAGLPSDIEWGFKNGELFVFQIRPITREFKPLSILVDTNLSESYPGTVSPFTAQFVKRAYAQVFRETALALGAQGKRYEQLSSHYDRLISAVDDHLYYNLEHYYAVLRALPGGDRNIQNWHKMIGGQWTDEVPFYDTKPNGVEVISALSSLIKLALKRKIIFGRLLKEFELTQTEIQQASKQLTHSSSIINYLQALLSRPLGFGLTALNDVFIMIGLGLTTKALKKKGLDESRIIDLLKTDDGVDSLKPLQLFNQLASELSNEFLLAFERLVPKAGFNPYPALFSQLNSAGLGEDVEKVQSFLKLYGDRSFEELKLESLPLNNDPGLLLQLLKWARSNPALSTSHHTETPAVSLNFLEQKVVSFTRECIAIREATRLWRGRYYHLLRNLVLQLGEKLQLEDPRWRQFEVHDFFSLNLDEWTQYSQGEISFESAKILILDRRSWQTKNQDYPEIIQWDLTEKLPKLTQQLESSGIVGQGVSPGTATGTALVLDGPHQALDSELTDFILVTKNTDPAWVYIMSRSKGLVSEKGSLLSHTAIIGRELNVPTVVGVRGATQIIKTGDRIKIDGVTGKIEIL